MCAGSRPSPDTATPDDVRRFQVHQTESGATASTINSAVSALRFLFTVTLDRPDLARRLMIMRNPRKVPDVLSVDEVARLLPNAVQQPELLSPAPSVLMIIRPARLP